MERPVFSISLSSSAVTSQEPISEVHLLLLNRVVVVVVVVVWDLLCLSKSLDVDKSLLLPLKFKLLKRGSSLLEGGGIEGVREDRSRFIS